MSEPRDPSAEPERRWREDFPFTSAGEEQVTRRDFTRYLAAASGAFAAGSAGVAVFASVKPTEVASTQAIIAVRDIPASGSYLFRYPTPADPAILIRLPDGELRAYSQKCTHLGCVVYWDESTRDILCPCHNGSFEGRTGNPIAGPPDRPLSKIAIEKRDGVIWALGESE